MESQRLSWEILDAFRDAAEEIGIPKTTDFNDGDNEGCGYFEVNQRSGIRWSAADAFLHPIIGRKNLTVYTHAHVKSVRFEGRKIKSVSFFRDKQSAEVQVDQEVLLSSGAVGSPQILQLSGIGCPELLRDNGIEPILELSGVGENLQAHLQMKMVIQYNRLLMEDILQLEALLMELIMMYG